MSSINGLGGNVPIQQTQNVAAPKVSGAAAGTPSAGTRASDRLELSGASGFLQTLKTSGDVRADKVASIKSQIDAGTYDADGSKLDASLDGLLDDMFS